MTIAARARVALLLAVIAGVLACKDSTPPPPPDPMIGDYPLRTIDGNAPPQVVAEDTTGRLSILSGMVRLHADKSFTDSTDVQFVSSAGQVSVSQEVAHGTWLVANDTLYLSPLGSPPYAMAVTITGLELTQDFEGIALVYRK